MSAKLRLKEIVPGFLWEDQEGNMWLCSSTTIEGPLLAPIEVARAAGKEVKYFQKPATAQAAEVGDMPSFTATGAPPENADDRPQGRTSVLARPSSQNANDGTKALVMFAVMVLGATLGVVVLRKLGGHTLQPIITPASYGVLAIFLVLLAVVFYRIAKNPQFRKIMATLRDRWAATKESRASFLTRVKSLWAGKKAVVEDAKVPVSDAEKAKAEAAAKAREKKLSAFIKSWAVVFVLVMGVLFCWWIGNLAVRYPPSPNALPTAGDLQIVRAVAGMLYLCAVGLMYATATKLTPFTTVMVLGNKTTGALAAYGIVLLCHAIFVWLGCAWFESFFSLPLGKRPAPAWYLFEGLGIYLGLALALLMASKLTEVSGKRLAKG